MISRPHRSCHRWVREKRQLPHGRSGGGGAKFFKCDLTKYWYVESGLVARVRCFDVVAVVVAVVLVAMG